MRLNFRTLLVFAALSSFFSATSFAQSFASCAFQAGLQVQVQTAPSEKPVSILTKDGEVIAAMPAGCFPVLQGYRCAHKSGAVRYDVYLQFEKQSSQLQKISVIKDDGQTFETQILQSCQ